MLDPDTLIRQLLDDSPIGMSVVDSASRKRLFVNRALVKMFGAANADDLLQANLVDSWNNPSDLVELQKYLDAEIPVVNFEAERRRLDGSTWWALMNSRPLVFDDRPARVVWHTDITDRKTVEATAQISRQETRIAEDRLLSAIEALEDGFVLYDSEDRFVLANQKYRDFFPHSAELMQPGKPFREILRHGLEQGEYDLQGKTVENWLAQRMETRKSANSVVEQKLANGTWLRISERRTAQGETVGFRVDVTGVKKNQAELLAAKETAEKAAEIKSSFLATMSHEIRTPLGGILGLADILMATKLDAEQSDLLEKLRAAGSGLLVILNDILDLSKLEAGKLTSNTSISISTA